MSLDLVDAEPSLEAWAAFTGAVARARPNRARSAALARSLRRWPPWLRTFPAPWFERALDGADEPWFAVACTADAQVWARSRGSMRAYDHDMGLLFDFGSAVDSFAASPAMRHVRWIRVSEVGGNALVMSPRARDLEGIDFGGSISPAALERVVEAPWTSGLVALRASGNGRAVPSGLWHDLAPRLGDVRSLWLRGMTCDGEFVQRLADNRRARRIETLRLAFSAIGGEGLTALAASETFHTLRELDLTCVRPDSEGLADLLHAEHLSRLHTLALGADHLDDSQAAALSRSPLMSALLELDLRSNRLTATGVAALVSSPAAHSLRSLTLRGNNIGDRGAIAIARSPHLTGLEHLNVRECHIGDDGTRALITSEGLTALRVINVMHNPGAKDLREELDARFERVIDYRG